MPGSRAHVRAVRSFFADHRSAGEVRICRGLSCSLNGASGLAQRLAGRGQAVRPVYCLGYCDRAPALLPPAGDVQCAASALAWPAPAAPRAPGADVRAVSRRAVVTERIGRGSHADLATARAAGVYATLRSALATGPDAVLDAVEASGERGRGGAGFPTGRKWRLAAAHASRAPLVVANGDEGDPGSFVDRMLLEDDPHAVLEGLALCAFALGAAQGVVYIRSEYPAARARMAAAVAEAREAGILGPSVLGSGFGFEVALAEGHGSYVCGEETALLNAIEGRRGEVRVRPPYPVERGLHGHPTVVNNIETLVNVPWILREGPDAYRRLGTPGSPGTKAICLNAGFARPGLVEVEFGVTLRAVVEEHGGGGRDGDTLAAIAVGGPMGSILLPDEFDARLDHDELAARGIRLGHGGLVAVPGTADPRALLVEWLEFMAEESCGKCVPCRRGSTEALAMARRLAAARESATPLVAELERLLGAVEASSLCGFGQGIPAPARRLAQLALRSAGA
jgi:NADH:ubiquinone oxidoreductase subunit F (NADH-binding)